MPSVSGVFQTDAQGRYTSFPLPPDLYNVEVIQTGFVPFRTSVAVMSGVPVTPVDVMLQATLPFTISGKVTDNMGAPLVATVRLTENSAIPGIITIQTGADGLYSITMDPGPYDGDYTIDVSAAGFASQSSTFTIPNGAMIPLNFTLLKQGTLAGHITDERGPPLGGAMVTVGQFATSSDTAGAYSITVDPGTYPVTASAFGYTPVSANIAIPSGVTVPQDFILSQTITGAIAGTVTDDNGSPLSGARVAALNTTLTTTDDNGQYTLTNLQPGPTEVMASLRRYVFDKETVTVVSGETVPQDFVLVLEGTRT
jgi:hypothetical protein